MPARPVPLRATCTDSTCSNQPAAWAASTHVNPGEKAAPSSSGTRRSRASASSASSPRTSAGSSETETVGTPARNSCAATGQCVPEGVASTTASTLRRSSSPAATVPPTARTTSAAAPIRCPQIGTDSNSPLAARLRATRSPTAPVPTTPIRISPNPPFRDSGEIGPAQRSPAALTCRSDLRANPHDAVHDENRQRRQNERQQSPEHVSHDATLPTAWG